MHATQVTAAAPWSQLRLRRTEHLREMLAETAFGVAQLVQPVFVVEGMVGTEAVPGLGDMERHGRRAAVESIARDVGAGVRHFMLFAVPAGKTVRNLDFRKLGLTVESIRREFGDALHLWVDICLCSSTTHGHCALLDEAGAIDLDATLHALGEAARTAADAGADGVAPSDMMDGRAAHIRTVLDAHGHRQVPIMSYSTKFASHCYGPFRGAADSAPQNGNRRTYQIDVRSPRDAVASSVRCADEGADLLMVKPALTSLDLIRPIADLTGRPVGAYQVSGEYASLVALAERGFADFDGAFLETLHVLRRAGAAFIVTYGARRARALGLAREVF